MLESHSPPGTRLDDVVRRVVVGQLLWTAGSTLTTGGFLLYFAHDLGEETGRDRSAMNLIIAILLVAPEMAGLAGLFGRSLVGLARRKWVYVLGTLLSRVGTIAIPLLAFPSLRPSGVDPLWLVVGCVAVTEAMQAVAYLAYLSWLSDLFPEAKWGRYFAVRNVAKVAGLMIVATFGGFLRDWWRRGVPVAVVEWLRLPCEQQWDRGLTEGEALFAYVVVFGVGIGLMILSVVPMLRLPDLSAATSDPASPTPTTWQRLATAFRDRSMRFLLLHQWWLAAANGLTQSAFFGFLFGTLHLGLGVFYLLFSTMRLVKLPVSLGAGRACDSGRAKSTLVWSLLVATMALPIWFVTTPDTWWLLFLAYALWGLYAGANIAGRNLVLEFAPRHDNVPHLALSRQIGGFVAGISGLLGGFWLDALTKANFTWHFAGRTVGPFHLLFAVSFVGRLTALLWLVPVEEPVRPTEISDGASGIE